jgi:hypothetical protein
VVKIEISYEIGEDPDHRFPSSDRTMNRQLAIKASLLRLPSRSFSVIPAIRSSPPPDPPSFVKSFLYGSEKGQELQREMEQSYSKVLARGKYVHKMSQHHVKPDKINEYVALMSKILELLP